MYACVHIYMCACMHICIYACMHMCMYAEVPMFLTRMMTANWSWVQVFEQHGDYKLVLRVIWPRKRPQRGPDCSPSEDYLCFLSTPSVPWGPSEVVLCTTGLHQTSVSTGKRVINELCHTLELSVLQGENWGSHVFEQKGDCKRVWITKKGDHTEAPRPYLRIS